MAGFLKTKEAAQMLGVSEDELNEIRQRQEIRAFKDGSEWKFKEEDVQELMGKRGSGPAAEGDDVLISDQEEGDTSSSGTVLSQSPGQMAHESDIEVDSGKTDETPIQSDVTLGDEESGLGSQFDDLEALELGTEGGGDMSPTSLGQASDFAASGDDDFTVSDDAAPVDNLASTVDLTAGDDEMVLGPSGSDVTLGGGESGISLLSPSDSGLSLDDEPLDITESESAVESLELGEDDMISLEEEAEPDAATQLKSDDDFLLTPLDSAADDPDSSSQVIELDESSEVLDTAETMLGGEPSGMASLLDDEDLVGAAADPLAQAPLGAASAALMPSAVPEFPYSIWNVLSLFLCVVLMTLTGIFMYDLLRNIWAWDEAAPMNVKLMDKILELIEPPK